MPGKGTMVAMNHRVLNTVVNRCKMPADGDIIVPIRTVAVIGTTDVHVPDPDVYGITPEEVALMLEEGEHLVPGISRARVLRAWAGVRPLYKDQDVASDRDISRTYKLLDHEARDGVAGMTQYRRRQVDHLPADGPGGHRRRRGEAGRDEPMPHPLRAAARHHQNEEPRTEKPPT